MAQEDESTIVIRGDATGAVAAVQQTERAIAQLQRTASGSVADSVRAAQQGAELHQRNAQMIEEAGRRSLAVRAAQIKAAAQQAAADRKAARESVDAWAKADVTGMFRPWLEARKQWLEGAEQVGTAAMTQRAALLALGGAAAAGAAAVAAAGVAIVASSVDVIANLEKYDVASSRHRAELQAAAAAYGGLGAQMTELRVEIAGQMAPAIQRYSDATAGLIEIVTKTVAALDDQNSALGQSYDHFWSMPGPMYPMILGYERMSDAIGQATDYLVSMGEEARRTSGALFDVQAAAAAAGEANVLLWAGGRINMEAEAEADRAAQEVADSWILASKAATTRADKTKALTAATHAQTERDREAELAVRGLVDAWGKATGALDGYMQQLDEANARTARAAQNRADTTQAGNVAAGRSAGAAPTIQDPAAVAALADNAEQASGRAARATGAQWRMAAQEVMGATSSMVGSVGSFIADSYAKQAEGANKYSQAHRNAMRKAFAAQKAAALAQAAISLALGIMQVWSSWSALPPVAAALTAVVGAVGAVQIGLIAAQKPSFHRGGLYQMAPGQAPDERSASVSMLQSERLAIIPQRGSLGAEGEVSRRSTGERSADAPAAPVVYIMDGSGRRSTRPFAGLSPLMGRRQIA